MGSQPIRAQLAEQPTWWLVLQADCARGIKVISRAWRAEKVPTLVEQAAHRDIHRKLRSQ